MDSVVPLAVEFIPAKNDLREVFIGDLDSNGILVLVYLRLNPKSLFGAGAGNQVPAIRLTITWWLISGLPRQF